MSTQLYKARYVLPITAAPIEDGAILIQNDRITAVGEVSQLPVPTDAETIDFGEAILMPPLVNAHTHLELTDFSKWAKQKDQEPGSFVDWILELIKTKHELEPEQLQRSVQHGLQQLLQSGTGAVCDILSVPALYNCYIETPLYGWLCYELIGLDDGMGAILSMMANDWLQYRSAGKLKCGLSPHAPYTVGPESLQKIVELAQDKQVMTSMHLGESPDETAFLAASQGEIANKLYPTVGWQTPTPPLATNPVDYVAKAGGLNRHNLLVHGVQLDADAIGRLARAGANLVLCPRSNERLEVGRAPIESYFCQGINLALGTDSLASNDSLSLWDEMAAARRIYGEILSPVQILAMATINGARALNISADFGSLEAEKGTHFQVLKPDHLPAAAELPEFLCCGERGSEVAHLYLDNVDVLAEPDLC
ncbi:MAG: metal-dependent hydrolase [Desulfuromonas sp.]|nr:MAG: metal-dependent hydrolase [Desulfuromonas sp.]